MDLRTDRVGLLTDQLSQSKDLSQQRLDGLTDAEYLWEPFDGMWSVRPRDRATTPDAYGPGEWVLDFERRDPFAPGPLTTIAWRVGHLLTMFAGRWHWTFGARDTDPTDLVDFTPRAEEALTQLWGWADRWRSDVEALSDEQLDTKGFGQYPWGLDPDIPIIGIVWWVNRELIHHLAEAALLRDLYLRMSTEEANPSRP